MKHAMTKDVFLAIYDRQRASGLSIKDFCENESYPAASFYYWKSKFGLGHSSRTPAAIAGEFAPIHFPVNKSGTSSSTDTHSVDGGIILELPNGLKVHFTGSSAADTTLHFITQLCSSHVLPK